MRVVSAELLTDVIHSAAGFLASALWAINPIASLTIVSGFLLYEFFDSFARLIVAVEDAGGAGKTANKTAKKLARELAFDIAEFVTGMLLFTLSVR